MHRHYAPHLDMTISAPNGYGVARLSHPDRVRRVCCVVVVFYIRSEFPRAKVEELHNIRLTHAELAFAPSRPANARCRPAITTRFLVGMSLFIHFINFEMTPYFPFLFIMLYITEIFKFLRRHVLMQKSE